MPLSSAFPSSASSHFIFGSNLLGLARRLFLGDDLSSASLLFRRRLLAAHQATPREAKRKATVILQSLNSTRWRGSFYEIMKLEQCKELRGRMFFVL